MYACTYIYVYTYIFDEYGDHGDSKPMAQASVWYVCVNVCIYVYAMEEYIYIYICIICDE